MYEEEHCATCVHYENGLCPVLMAHMIHNYEECNKPESILHLLIPRNGTENEKCKMHYPITITPAEREETK